MGAAKSDACGNGHLAEKIEPAGDPGEKGRVWVRGQDGGPEVRPAGGWYGGDDFGHTQSDEHGEEGDAYPADGHDAWAASAKAIFKESGDAGDDALSTNRVRVCSISGILLNLSLTMVVYHIMTRLFSFTTEMNFAGMLRKGAINKGAVDKGAVNEIEIDERIEKFMTGRLCDLQ